MYNDACHHPVPLPVHVSVASSHVCACIPIHTYPFMHLSLKSQREDNPVHCSAVLSVGEPAHAAQMRAVVEPSPASEDGD